MSGPTNLEPIGLFVFVCCLGTVVVRRILGSQERLATLQEEMKIARQIQLFVLPAELPVIEGLAIGARYLPSSSVAGDLYDFAILPDRGIGILVADVAGHGVPAALFASMVKVACDFQAHHATDPAKVLAGMNETLHGRLGKSFVTAGYLFLDAKNRQALYSGAGHPALLQWSAREKRVIEHSETGLVLGLLPGPEYSNIRFSVEAGDRVVLYTDGIVEAPNTKDEHFGKDRFKRFIEAQSAIPADRFCDVFVSALRDWSGEGPDQGQADDLTLIVVDVV